MHHMPTGPDAARVLPDLHVAFAAESVPGRDATGVSQAPGLHVQQDPPLCYNWQAFVRPWEEGCWGAPDGFPLGECLQEKGDLEGSSAVALRALVGGPFPLYR